MTKIYTCTLNLAIDLFMETNFLKPFAVNRTQDDDIQANGKGVNVSLVLNMLGIKSTTLGFKAGFTGQYIEDFLKEKRIDTNFIKVPGLTRINVFTQVHDTQEEFKLVNKGPKIPKENVVQFLKQVEELEAGDFICVSGSLPRGVSPSILIEIAKYCHEKKVSLVLDSSYQEVLECLNYQPFLLKPNDEELADWFDVSIASKEDYLRYGKRLLELGAQNVLLSLGGEGAYFFSKNTILHGNAPKGRVVNTACSGDTLLGTFLGGILKNESLTLTLKKSLAAGSSTAFRQGLTDFSDVEILEQQIAVNEEEI